MFIKIISKGMYFMIKYYLLHVSINVHKNIYIKTEKS